MSVSLRGADADIIGASSAICGAVLLHLPLGSLYCLGNLVPYLASYLKYEKGVDEPILSLGWLFALTGSFHALTMVPGGLLAERVGPRIAALLGSVTLSCGVALTFWTIQTGSLTLLFLSYAVLSGVGTGLTYAQPMSILLLWFPSWKGRVAGITLAGFGGGALVFNEVQRRLINPLDTKPVLDQDGNKYFADPSVLAAVPTCFLSLASIYVCLQICGILLLRPPPPLRTPLSSPASSPLQVPLTFPAESSVSTLDRLPTSFSPKEALGDPRFRLLFLMFMLEGTAVSFIASFWKRVGEDHMDVPDSWLVALGCFSSLCNALSRVAWGRAADLFGFRKCQMALIGTMVVALGVLLPAAEAGFFAFFLVASVMWCCIGGIFALFPAAVASFFGPDHFSVIYGYVFLAVCPGYCLSAIFAPVLLRNTGESGTLGCLVGCYVVAGFLNKRIKM